MELKETILIIDGYNLFIRCYVAFPTMNKNGEQVGGIVGFIKKISDISTIFMPKKIYIVWEGGGSSRRKKIRSTYKEKRVPKRMNRFYGDDIPDTLDNQINQLKLLISVLRDFPVVQLYLDNIEADDIIGFLTKNIFLQEKKIIASSDKDIYQLIDNNTEVWDLFQKKLFSINNIFDEFRVFPNNFGLVKTICGDRSDNIEGIKGIGFTNFIKYFPILSQQEDVLLDDIIKYAAANIDKSKIYQRVFEQKNFLKENWNLINLCSNTLSYDQTNKLKYIIENSNPKFNLFNIKKFFSLNGIFIDQTIIELFMKMSYISPINFSSSSI
jgi:DNA polymerase-1